MNALLGETIGGEVRRDALFLRNREHAQHRVVDLVRFAEGTRRGPAGKLAVDVDHAARVGDVVWRVENVALLELFTVTLFEQLIVRRAGDDLDLELRDRLVVDDRTERAGGEDVRLHAVDLLGRDGTSAELVGDSLHALGIDVRDDELRARLVQLFSKVITDMPAALERHGAR